MTAKGSVDDCAGCCRGRLETNFEKDAKLTYKIIAMYAACFIVALPFLGGMDGFSLDSRFPPKTL